MTLMTQCATSASITISNRRRANDTGHLRSPLGQCPSLPRVPYQVVDAVVPHLNLQTAVAKWPTPTARDHKDTGDLLNVPVNGLLGRAVNPSKTSGSLNPTWVEWLQGFPKEWTVCEGSETPSSRSSRSSSSKPSHEKSKFADNPADKT